MTRRQAYAAVVAALVVFGSPILSVVASVRIAENNAERILREQDAQRLQAEAAARAESKRLACDNFSLNLDVYDETPPISKAGKNLRANYLEFYQLSGCQPPRK